MRKNKNTKKNKIVTKINKIWCCETDLRTHTTTLKMTPYGKIRNVVDTITMTWDAFELELLSKDITRRSKRIEKKLDKL